MTPSLRAAVIQEWRGLPERLPSRDRWQAPADVLPKLMQRLGLRERLHETEVKSAPKILVRAANGDLWLIKKGATPVKVHSNQPNVQPQDPDLVEILTTTDNNLASHFASANPGVKAGIAVVDFDGQY